jgi:hypothetical protein
VHSSVSDKNEDSLSLEPATDIAPADWVVDGLRGFGESVLSLVPAGFAAYVRIFHPGYRRQGDRLAPVRWSEIAAANGSSDHAGMQLTSLTGSFEFYTDGQPGVFDAAPTIGSLPLELAESLAEVLGPQTTTPEAAWFAFWNGFGGIRHEIAIAPTFSAPHRDYHLLAGPVEAFSESADGLRYQSANLCWPDDRAWCVASEIDLDTTYVGCSGGAAAAILADDCLEALSIDPAKGIAFDSDEQNPPAPRSVR